LPLHVAAALAGKVNPATWAGLETKASFELIEP
jgi:hypothetical protein